MPRHKDFEIWFDEETQRYRFSVEYWGGYGAKTREEIEEKVKRVRRDVRARLRQIDEQNKAYYARLARQEELLKKELKAFKANSKKEFNFLKYKELSVSERAKLLRMIFDGFDELEIKKIIPVNSSTIAALKNKREKNVCKNIQKHETVSGTSRSGVIMPSYSTDVLGGRHLSDK
jgi:hypothetical protein